MSDDPTPGSADPGDPARRPAPGSRRDDIRRRLDQPSDDVLREPSDRERLRRGSTGRLTVAELLAQMNDPSASSRAAATPPPATPPPSTPPPSTRSPVGDTDNDRTENIPPVVDDIPAPPPPPRPAPRTAVAPEVLPPRGDRVAKAAQRSSRVRTARTAARVVIVVGAVLALVGTGTVWGYLRVTNGGFRTIEAVDSNDKNIRNKGAQYGDQTYLIVGTDTRVGNNGKVGAGTTADAEGARSDTVILVNVPANRSRVVAVSFPRDLQIDRPDCESWDNNTATYDPNNIIPAETGAKLNTAYGDGGPKCAVKVIQQLSGLNINHFIAMDFFGFEQVVNKLGGVQVCSPTPLYDYELGQILSRPGKQTVKGQRALNYVRARTIDTEGNGDYGRIKRQQLFMSALLRGMLSGQVLSNPARLNGIINTFTKYSYVDGIDTDSLVNLAQSLEGLQAGRVTFLTIPTSGTTTDGSNNEIPRNDDINAIFDAIINDDPLPGEQKASAPSSSSSSKAPSSSAPSTTPQAPQVITASAQSPSAVGVRVLNGTGTTGLATRVSDQMSQLGFDVRGVADASENQTQTVVRYGPGEQAAAATVASMITGAVIQSDRTVKSGVEVLLGSDYPGEIGAVPTAGESLRVTENPRSDEAVDLPGDLSVTNAADTSCSG
ncbi:transcriptional regulator [Williamsia sp. Leaf354]|uniref:LCP family protein n=1 Tax=Williamsia sp. Leaf354 TaxID=1736349 RepID=UPI0006F1E793|nr:LCP family protein [Williamsia sp. Leaf354]KQS00512.1 transcriptional regulator [Williamsia sp. Leaf354]